MSLAIRIGTGLAALGLVGALGACSSSSTPSGAVSSASSIASGAVSSASSAATSAASQASSAAGSLTTSGSASSAPLTGSATVNNITGGSTVIKFDQNYLTALNTLKLNPSATGDAQLSGDTATLPITGGNLTVTSSGAQGSIKHSGGIALHPAAATVTLTNFVLDPGANAIYADIQANGNTLASHVPFFTLNFGSAQLQSSGGTTTISNVALALSDDAATALNQATNSTAIQGNFPVGTATVTVKGS